MKKLMFKFATKLLLSAFILVTLNAQSFAQKNDVNEYLGSLPKNLKLTEDGPQKYLITTDYFNGDIFGNFLNKTRVTGEYTRGLKDGMVKWNHVTMASGTSREGSFVDSVALDYMENFSYTPSENLVDASFFIDFPPNSFQARNLIWDMLGVEIFAWVYFDSLELNQIYRPKEINGVVQLAGQGSFENRDIQLRWNGISRVGPEICALIEYRTMDNPLVIDTEQIKIKGRSHYWGTIWVSLEDKQIEYAELYEDVVMKMKMGNQSNDELMNTTRAIVFEKIN